MIRTGAFATSCVTTALALFVAAAGASLAAEATTHTAGPAASSEAPHGREGAISRNAKPEKLAPGVYLLGDRGVPKVPNIGIIEGKRGLMVIDTGMGPENGRAVINAVRRVAVKPIRYLTITHFHGEHGMGAQSFPLDTLVIYPELQRQELFSKGMDWVKVMTDFYPDTKYFLDPVRLRSPDITFEKEATIDLGDMNVRLVNLPAAHTRGDNLVFVPSAKIVFTGDVVLAGLLPILADDDANARQWLEALDAIAALEPAVIVPGHGPRGGPELLAVMRDILTVALDTVTTLKKQGKSLEEVQEAVRQKIEPAYPGYGNTREFYFLSIPTIYRAG